MFSLAVSRNLFKENFFRVLSPLHLKVLAIQALLNQQTALNRTLSSRGKILINTSLDFSCTGDSLLPILKMHQTICNMFSSSLFIHVHSFKMDNCVLFQLSVQLELYCSSVCICYAVLNYV